MRNWEIRMQGFLHFLARAWNGRQYSNFVNKCPKLGTGTPEDMVLTNLGNNLDFDHSGFVLLCMYVIYVLVENVSKRVICLESNFRRRRVVLLHSRRNSIVNTHKAKRKINKGKLSSFIKKFSSEFIFSSGEYIIKY